MENKLFKYTEISTVTSEYTIEIFDDEYQDWCKENGYNPETSYEEFITKVCIPDLSSPDYEDWNTEHSFIEEIHNYE